jgi:hypothetical protein
MLVLLSGTVLVLGACSVLVWLILDEIDDVGPLDGVDKYE